LRALLDDVGVSYKESLREGTVRMAVRSDDEEEGEADKSVQDARKM